MAGVNGWSKNGIGKSRRSRSRASTPSRFFRCCKIHFAGFSEKRPSRVLPTMTEMTVMLLLLAVRRKKKGWVDKGNRLSLGPSLVDRSATNACTRMSGACTCAKSDVVAQAKFKIASLLKTVLKHFANEGLSFGPRRRGNKRLV